MRKIEGFVCIVKMETNTRIREVMFGKNTGKGMGIHQNFQSNSLTPFPNFSEVEWAKKELEARDDFGDKDVSVASVEIVLAETEEDIIFFQNKRNLVVVQIVPEFGETYLIGRRIKGKPGIYPLYGAFLEFNGLETINSFKDAEWIAREVHRQAQCAAPIGTFILKRINS